MSQTDSAETYNQETAMSEPVDIVAEMRGFADALESVAPLVETPANLRRWADHMERLQALVEWHRVELTKQIEMTNTLGAEVERLQAKVQRLKDFISDLQTGDSK